jgi:hypothetical protein
MLDWIVVDVVQVPLQVCIVTNDVVPKAFLPELHGACDTHNALVSFGKVGLEGVHDLAKRAASSGLDEQVEVIGEEDIAQHGKGMQFFDPMQG